MDNLQEMRRAINDLLNLLEEPMSSRAAEELTKSIGKLKSDLDAEEAKMIKGAADELTHLEQFTRNPMATCLISGLIDALKNPHILAHSVLIRAVLSYGENDQIGPVTDSLSVSSRKTMPKVLMPSATPALGHTKKLNIWSNEVYWNNDRNFVRIYLPVLAPVTLENITCSFLHLELGHRLKLEYPGVHFSVLINHTKIKGAVEVCVTPFKVTIRLAKTNSSLWSYITLIEGQDDGLIVHLDKENKLLMGKAVNLMMLIKQVELDSQDSSGYPHPSLLDLIEEHEMDPRPFLDSVREKKFKTVLGDTGYNLLCECFCDRCVQRSPSSEKCKMCSMREERKQIHLCEIWWTRDEDHMRIYLPKNGFNGSHEQVEYILSQCEIGHRLEVTFPGSVFVCRITFDLAQANFVKCTVLPDFVKIRLTKERTSFWPLVSLVTGRKDKKVTYHLNPYYHLEVKHKNWTRGTILSELKHILLIMRSHPLSFEDIFTISHESSVLHHSSESLI